MSERSLTGDGAVRPDTLAPLTARLQTLEDEIEVGHGLGHDMSFEEAERDALAQALGLLTYGRPRSPGDGG